MNDRAAILKILSVQTLFCEIMIKIAPYLGRICEYGLIGLKTTPFSLGNVFLCQIYAQLAGLIERPYHGLGHRSKHLPSQVLP